MAERPKWMPDHEAIAAAHEADYYLIQEPSHRGGYDHIEALITSAVEQAVAEERVKWLEIEKASRARHAADLNRARLEAKIEALEEADKHQYPFRSIIDQLDLCRAALAALEEKP